MTTPMQPKGEPITLPPLTCAECGMLCTAREFHPFAACLMFKACRDGDKVRSNLEFLRERLAVAAPVARVEKHTGSLRDMAIIVWLGEQPPEGTLLYAAPVAVASERDSGRGLGPLDQLP